MNLVIKIDSFKSLAVEGSPSGQEFSSGHLFLIYHELRAICNVDKPRVICIA